MFGKISLADKQENSWSDYEKYPDRV